MIAKAGSSEGRTEGATKMFWVGEIRGEQRKKQEWKERDKNRTEKGALAVRSKNLWKILKVSKNPRDGTALLHLGDSKDSGRKQSSMSLAALSAFSSNLTLPSTIVAVEID